MEYLRQTSKNSSFTQTAPLEGVSAQAPVSAPPVQLQAGGSMEMSCGCDGCPSCQEAAQIAEAKTPLHDPGEFAEGNDPISQAVGVMEKAMALHSEKENFSEVSKLELAITELEKLRGQEESPQVTELLHQLDQSARGNPVPISGQDRQSHITDQEPPVQRAVFALAIPAVALQAIALTGIVLAGAYVLSQTRVEPIPMPLNFSRHRSGTRKIRCTARPHGGQNPPDHCPKRVFGTGKTKGEAQRDAKNTAPEECRKFYGHCGWVS